jgi:flavin reductase (DIM6/NTAB) family NADH-FMN oxidoreductase RutF
MKSINPKEQNLRENYHLMISGITPRPIALVSSIDRNGQVNLALYSFFNGFGANPPIVGFSPSFSGRTGLPKDSLLNIRETEEFTISVVDSDMVEQMSLTSGEYDKGIDEFVKGGFHRYNSLKVKSPGVAESKFIMECKLHSIIDLGGKPGSGNLILGEIVQFHVNEQVYDENGKIDPFSMDSVGRLGYAWYNRVSSGIFELNKAAGVGIGFDQLPDYILKSDVLTGNDLAKLASVNEIPKKYNDNNNTKYNTSSKVLHELCREAIHAGDLQEAWQIVFIIGGQVG